MRFLLLVLLAVVVSAVPQGFTTFFYSQSCPPGWSPLQTTEGRLVLSVSDPMNAGITVNSPLKDQEDRVHTHAYTTVVDIPSKSVAAIDCCNNQGACNGNYQTGGSFADSASGLPFVQLPLCTLNQANNDPVPFGTIGFFSPAVSTCPSNWMAMSEANGRILLPGYADVGVVPSAAAPISAGQDIVHTHTFSTNLKVNDVSYEGVDGCCNDHPAPSGSYPVAGNSSSASSGLPYISLLTCLSQEPSFSSNFPTSTLLFNSVGCPPGWNVSLEASGRFLSSLPNGGEAGASFGGPSIKPGSTGSISHTHDFSGSIDAPSCGVGLASGCCGDGYMAAGNYEYAGISQSETIDVPFLSVPMCVQLG